MKPARTDAAVELVMSWAKRRTRTRVRYTKTHRQQELPATRGPTPASSATCTSAFRRHEERSAGVPVLHLRPRRRSSGNPSRWLSCAPRRDPAGRLTARELRRRHAPLPQGGRLSGRSSSHLTQAELFERYGFFRKLPAPACGPRRSPLGETAADDGFLSDGTSISVGLQPLIPGHVHVQHDQVEAAPVARAASLTPPPRPGSRAAGSCGDLTQSSSSTTRTVPTPRVRAAFRRFSGAGGRAEGRKDGPAGAALGDDRSPCSTTVFGRRPAPDRSRCAGPSSRRTAEDAR
jgi:hypothetical protein